MNVIKGTIKSAMPSMMMPLEIRAAFESSVEKSKNNEGRLEITKVKDRLLIPKLIKNAINLLLVAIASLTVIKPSRKTAIHR